MRHEQQNHLFSVLGSDTYKKRLARAKRFESISGGGVAKQIERLVRAPGIYIPYLLHVKAGLSRVMSITATLCWGRTIHLPMNDYDAFILYLYGGLYGEELKLAKFFIKNISSQEVFYDIGANRGFFTYLAAELCKEIHTFEPMPALAEVIRKNIRRNDSITVNAAALSNSVGSIDFYVTSSTMVNTIDKEVAEQYAAQTHSSVKKITVPTTTLDEYVKTHPAPTVLKIDAEGAEGLIIDGGRQFLATHSPIISLEVWGKKNNGEVSMQAVEKLRALGYKSFQINDEGDVHEVQGDLSALADPRGADNFVFKK